MAGAFHDAEEAIIDDSDIIVRGGCVSDI
eukprot:COSAG01_NODE_15782_length_1300_cov_1.592007_1_plen_28_part_10